MCPLKNVKEYILFKKSSSSFKKQSLKRSHFSVRFISVCVYKRFMYLYVSTHMHISVFLKRKIMQYLK